MTQEILTFTKKSQAQKIKTIKITNNALKNNSSCLILLMVVQIPYPLGARIACPFCDKHYARSSWRRNLTAHISKCHPSVDATLIGVAPCGVTFPIEQHNTNRHLATCADCIGIVAPSASTQPTLSAAAALIFPSPDVAIASSAPNPSVASAEISPLQSQPVRLLPS